VPETQRRRPCAGSPPWPARCGNTEPAVPSFAATPHEEDIVRAPNAARVPNKIRAILCEVAQ